MSDETNNNLLELGGDTFEMGVVTFEHSTRVADPEKPGKKKSVPDNKELPAPVLTDNSVATRLFAAMLAEADSLEAGNGLKLAGVLLNKRFEEAAEAAFDLAAGTEDVGKYVKTLVSPERARSSGQTLDAINAELAEYAVELGVLGMAAGSSDGWKSIKDASGAPLYSDQGKFILRLDEVSKRVQNLNLTKENRVAKLEEQRAVRSAKKAAAEAAAKQAGAAAVPAA